MVLRCLQFHIRGRVDSYSAVTMNRTTKAVALTALLTALLALPFVVKKHKEVTKSDAPVMGGSVSGELLRYDIDDLLT